MDLAQLPPGGSDNMKKTILILLTIFLFSFQSQKDEKKLKFEFTVNEVNLIYMGLGKLPAEQVQDLRIKIAMETNKQLDTTKKK